VSYCGAQRPGGASGLPESQHDPKVLKFSGSLLRTGKYKRVPEYHNGSEAAEVEEPIHTSKTFNVTRSLTFINTISDTACI
jgi:hypothetical protein